MEGPPKKEGAKKWLTEVEKGHEAAGKEVAGRNASAELPSPIPQGLKY